MCPEFGVGPPQLRLLRQYEPPFQVHPFGGRLDDRHRSVILADAVEATVGVRDGPRSRLAGLPVFLAGGKIEALPIAHLVRAENVAVDQDYAAVQVGEGLRLPD